MTGNGNVVSYWVFLHYGFSCHSTAYVLFLSQCRPHTVFFKVVNLLVLILQHNWIHKVKICYVSLKCNASKYTKVVSGMIMQVMQQHVYKNTVASRYTEISTQNVIEWRWKCNQWTTVSEREKMQKTTSLSGHRAIKVYRGREGLHNTYIHTYIHTHIHTRHFIS